MKIQYMKAQITPLVPKLQTHRALLAAASYPGNLNKRVRWDAMTAAGLTAWLCDTLYPYLNDDHIDTALRHIQSELLF